VFTPVRKDTFSYERKILHTARKSLNFAAFSMLFYGFATQHFQVHRIDVPNAQMRHRTQRFWGAFVPPSDAKQDILAQF
jgi:hypothetical protein